MIRSLFVGWAIAFPFLPCLAADPDSAVVAKEDFEQGLERWEFKDPECWKLVESEDGQALSLFRKDSTYQPPHRSPLHMALLEEALVGSFELTVDVKSTHEEYGHRDVTVFFGYLDPAHFYYVHLASETDPHANQIFIVDGGDRRKISLTTTDGTKWSDGWHKIRVTRDVDSGDIKIYFDDMKKPAMTAKDKSFMEGQVGLGSFDDTAIWDNLVLRGEAIGNQGGE